MTEKQATKIRQECRQMIEEMSPDALAYCCEVVRWAYYWTDQRDPDRLTDNDHDRFTLLHDAKNWTDSEKCKLIRTFGNSVHGLDSSGKPKDDTHMSEEQQNNAHMTTELGHVIRRNQNELFLKKLLTHAVILEELISNGETEKPGGEQHE